MLGTRGPNPMRLARLTTQAGGKPKKNRTQAREEHHQTAKRQQESEIKNSIA